MGRLRISEPIDLRFFVCGGVRKVVVVRAPNNTRPLYLKEEQSEQRALQIGANKCWLTFV